MRGEGRPGPALKVATIAAFVAVLVVPILGFFIGVLLLFAADLIDRRG